MDTNLLIETIDFLKRSPLFYLFVSSRELFHSNFWYWLSTLNPVETVRLFSDLPVPNETLNFVREHRQASGKGASVADLLIRCSGEPWLVIENKVKDFPTLTQLQRIRDSFDNDQIGYVLATLFSCPELKFDGWKVRTYQVISDAIRAENFSDSEYHKSLIEDYKMFLARLAKVANLLPLTKVYDFAKSFNETLFRSLDEIKMWEGYQKLRSSHLLLHFANRMGIETSYSINHQKATINFHYPLRNNYEILISIEDNQFRRHIAGGNIDFVAKNMISRQIFLSPSFPGRGGKPYLKYDNKGPKQYRYQYDRLDNLIPFDVLFERICDEISEIDRNKKLIESCLP